MSASADEQMVREHQASKSRTRGFESGVQSSRRAQPEKVSEFDNGRNCKRQVATQVGDLSEPVVKAKSNHRWLASVLFSSAMHVVALIVLGLIYIVIPREETPVISALMLDKQDEAHLPELADDVDLNTSESENQLNAGGQSVAVELTAPVAEVDVNLPQTRQSLITSTSASQPWSDVNVSQRVDILGSALGKIASKGVGDGNGAGEGDGAGAFFGLKPIGKRFVFVMDCSKSMNHPHGSDSKTRFKRMKLELLNSIGTMDPDMQFFIVFFNDFAIPMPSRVLEPAFPNAKIKFLNWTNKIKAIGGTEPTHAMRIAMNLNPDVIYFLTDGTFMHRVEEELLSVVPKHTVVHTFAFKEPLNEAMKNAFLLIDADENVAARRSVTKDEFRKTRAIWKAHQFLEKLAEKHKGRFSIIP